MMRNLVFENRLGRSRCGVVVKFKLAITSKMEGAGEWVGMDVNEMKKEKKWRAYLVHPPSHCRHYGPHHQKDTTSLWLKTNETYDNSRT
jgi:hypothetical protein